MRGETLLILHDIRSNHNVGSIFRTADAAGINKIYLTGFTPAPIDKYGRRVKEISKVALGAEQKVPWEKKNRIGYIIDGLKKDGFQIIAVEQHKSSINYRRIKLTKRRAIILGNEVNGLPESIIKMCDEIAEIPMKGAKESLNVSVAAGVAIYSLLKL